MPKPGRRPKTLTDKIQVKTEYDIMNLKVEHDMIIKKEEPMDPPFHQAFFRIDPIATLAKKMKKPKAKPLAGVKNVVKNYGKAMCSFAYSEICMPYLNGFANEEKSTVKGFTDWIQTKKESVDSIESLRWLLLPSEQEDPTIAGYKKMFQKTSEVFLKYYCVNWIYSGKLTHRQTHLSFRHKMLRRIRNPEQFTYLQNTMKKKAEVTTFKQEAV